MSRSFSKNWGGGALGAGSRLSVEGASLRASVASSRDERCVRRRLSAIELEYNLSHASAGRAAIDDAVRFVAEERSSQVGGEAVAAAWQLGAILAQRSLERGADEAATKRGVPTTVRWPRNGTLLLLLLLLLLLARARGKEEERRLVRERVRERGVC